MRMRASTSLLVSVAGVCGLVGALAGCTSGARLENLERGLLADPPQTVSVEIDGYVPVENRKLHNFFVSNFSVKVSAGQLSYSTARDGLTDELKQRLAATYGFGINLPDSRGNFYGDLLKYLSGISFMSQSSLFCGLQQRQSSSNDAFTYNDTRLPGAPQEFLGLRDCEKSFIQLKPLEFDLDGDGIPDYLELRNGLNPRNASDASLSSSNDGVPNIEKVKRNIPIDEDANSQPNRIFGYKYESDLDPRGIRTLKVKNIPVLAGGLENFIAFYLTETDLLTHKDMLYSAYMILHRPAAGTTLRFNFWGTDISHMTNQEIVQP